MFWGGYMARVVPLHIKGHLYFICNIEVLILALLY